MQRLYPLRFAPIFRRYLWGGRRLATLLGKPIGAGDDYAESWEVCDHGPEQSVVAAGPCTGLRLTDLVSRHGAELLGRQAPLARFPLLFKFLDACQPLSVQVHPDDARAAQLNPPDLGKTEAWIILAADPGSSIYAGLKRGVDRDSLRRGLELGTLEDCLHRYEPCVGDCLFLPAGAVHSLGAGLVVAEIQQSSDTTYRLYDFNRLGPDGRPRPLHVEQALEAIDFSLGPLAPARPFRTDREPLERLVECDKFLLDRWEFRSPESLGGDGRFHFVAVLQGEVEVAGDPCGRPLVTGETMLLPAEIGGVLLSPRVGSVIVDAYLP